MKAIKFNYKARPKEHGLRVKMLSVRKKKKKVRESPQIIIIVVSSLP